MSQFRSANGSINSESFTIERGYKSGQGHRNNGGAGSGNQGGGGAGARGGTGATIMAQVEEAHQDMLVMK